MSWSTATGPLDLSRPLFIGILNATPDSFSDGGLHLDPAAALARARHLARRGARMLDLGAESTRPGARSLDPAEEWARLEPLLRLLRRELPELPLSVDTRRPFVAERALADGISVLNDVTGFRDPALLALAREASCGLIAMRSRLEGGVLLMPPYDGEGEPDARRALEELAEVRQRLEGAGIPRERVLLDPGFGFGTTYGEDLALFRQLSEGEGLPGWERERVCIGLSRKRFLARRAGNPALPPPERDGLTEAAHAELHRAGCRVFRTHELPEPRIRPARPGESAGAGAGEGVRTWVLERAWQIQGECALATGTDTDLDPGRHLELGGLRILPEAQGLGFGRELLARALADSRAEAAFAWIQEGDARGRGFCEHLGWRPDGLRRSRPCPEGSVAELRYRKELRVG